MTGCGLVTSNRGGDEEVSEGRRAGDGDRGGRIHVGGVEAEQCEAWDWRDKKLRKGFEDPAAMKNFYLCIVSIK